jgi:hypothetical protein
VPLDCPGSRTPVPHLKPLDEIARPACERRVTLMASLPEGLTDLWRGDTHIRVGPHWRDPSGDGKPED